MTNERKPATPDMAEVSPNFVEEAEATAAAPPSSTSVSDDPLLSLRAERQQVKAKIVATPDADENEEKALWQSIQDVETRIIEALPQTFLGALAQLEVLASMADEGLPEFAMDIIAGMNKQIPARIERLLATSFDDPEDAVPAVEDPILVLERDYLAQFEDYKRTDKEDGSDETMEPLHAEVMDAECALHRTPATTVAGIAVKLKMWTRNHCPGRVSYDWWKAPLDEFDDNLDELPILSALHDLERMAQESATMVARGALRLPTVGHPNAATETHVAHEAYRTARNALVALTSSDGFTAEDEVKADKAAHETYYRFLGTQARTASDLLLKMEAWAEFDCWDRIGEHIPQGDLDKLADHGDGPAAGVAALRDLRRMAHAAPVAGTPSAKDAALFEALAEYDRLVIVSDNLERRKDVFRPGIPEAEEANTAYEAAYDKTMEAWQRARDIPATTQADLFAKLQATVRFMTDLGEDQLYEAEWNAIKADVRRIAGEGSHDVPT